MDKFDLSVSNNISENSTLNIINHQKNYFSEFKLLSKILDTIPNTVLVLNSDRKIVYANKSMFSKQEKYDLYGLLPGDIINCSNSFGYPGSCGNLKECTMCGMLKSIQQSKSGIPNMQECRITRQDSGIALDLRIWTNPIEINNEIFIILVIEDISSEKRKRLLERIFFHDILNTTGNIKNSLQYLQNSGSKISKYKNQILSQLKLLIDEIKAQRDLTSAENGELSVNLQIFNVNDLFNELIYFYENNAVSKGKIINISSDSDNISMYSNRTLISRVLGNMIKNAIEAINVGDTITIGSKKLDKQIQIWVHNPGYMNEEIQLQVFQRSFSTKGMGRGIGTYSMKLLSEKYLGGKIHFISSIDCGTTFYAEYPLYLEYE